MISRRHCGTADASLTVFRSAFLRGIDKQKGSITVQAGARVSQILEELQKQGLTLENFSSITEAGNEKADGWAR